MKRLPKVLVAISTVIVLIMALAIIGLRLFLPQINEYRNQLEGQIQTLTGIPFKIGHIEGEWVSFGPVLTISDVSVTTEKVNIKVKKVKFSFDIWRSLFSLHLRFRDIIFYQLNADCYKPLEFVSEGDFSHFDLDALDELFLKQFDYFTLKESRITFLTPSAEKRTLKIPELTWLNQNEYHRAQGFVNLDSVQQQQDQDAIQIKLNLRNKNGVINEGTVYLQADNVNLRPWLSRWLRDSTGLQNAVFSLSSWITIKDSRIEGGQLQLHQGQANWQVDEQEHQLTVDDLLLTLHRQENGWLFNIPQLQQLKTDQQQWLEGQISLLYLPQSTADENLWRIRVNNIQLERLRSILPIFSFFTPEFISDWQKRQPKGQLIALALDITPDKPEKALIDVTWQDISWIRWKDLPSVSHFSGSLRGSQQGGVFSFNLNNSFIEYAPMFKAPLEISTGQGTISWSEEDNSRQIWSENLQLQAKSLSTTGDFRYLAIKDQPPILSILLGAQLTDAGEAWRYFPATLMGKDLTDYLTKAIIAGHVDAATMIFHGDPADFPFKKNNGQFQVFVPLRNATFKYQPDWPTIFDLDIDLNFERNGLWMSAPSVKLGDATALDLSASIADYSQSKLLIKSNVSGDGKAIRNYFNHSPMEGSIGKALDAVKIGGNINGKLVLNIPLEENSGSVIASGQVDLNNNDVDITAIDSQLKQLTGRFYFLNGDLKSEKLQAQWFGQPINLTFNTTDQRQNYQIIVNVDGNWQAKKIAILPKSITRYLAGSTAWQGQVNIQLPNQLKQNPTLSIALNSKLGQLGSQLPGLDSQQLRQLADMQIRASGNTRQLQIYGDVGQQISFNTEWQFTDKQVRLLKGAFQPYIPKRVVLPNSSLIMINLPEISDPKWFSWLALFSSLNLAPQNYGKSFVLPDIAIVNLPKITFAKQQWDNMVFAINKTAELTKIVAQSDMLKGSLTIPKQGNWQARINYLYFNPEISSQQQDDVATNNIAQRYDIFAWPNMDIYCSECWVAGYKLGELKAQIIRNRQTLILKEGSLINSATNLKISGIWYADQQNSTSIRGILKGNRFDDLAAYYGILVPIKQAPFKIDFDLNWATVPWQPDVNSLNGNLSFNLTKGAIAQMGGGGAGQLLRFVSFDALLRKLQLDFSDTFSNDFAFDSIRGRANIKNGILNTDDFSIDGLMADIAIHGKINLVRRDMNLEAIITPEISATVGVATAFAVNPLAGAAVFAATRVLGPLWSKISVIRYRITGSLEQPKIDETLRQLKENQQDDK
ncbi:AsmA2 domain-containing protein YhdP [Arsenophonus apicola]|uniref:AsmA2 domain-containing protein YhdP n=1 Tax=Arsenophonus apicola TaxID=2879119 RepID=UPI003879DD6D